MMMRKSDLQEADLARIEFAMKQAFPDTNWEPVSILSGGLSGAAIYKIIVNNKMY